MEFSLLNVSAIAIDLRGTLVEVDRKNNLSRNIWIDGISQEQASSLDESVPARVLADGRDQYDVLDWTLVTIFEYVEEARRHGGEIGGVELERSIRRLNDDYVDSSRGLIAGEMLGKFLEFCDHRDIQVCVAADGPEGRARSVINNCFPRLQARFSSIFGATTFGCNKYHPNYWKRLAEEMKTSAGKILAIGDRWEKDVAVAKQGGCQTLLVGDHLNAQFPTLESWVSRVMS